MPTLTILALMLGMLAFSACAQNEPSPDDVITALITKADQGDAEAQYKLGLIYRNGQGVPQDYKEVVRWLRLAAEQGLDEAQSELGVRYGNGQGVPQDNKEAARWYGLAADQGYALGQYNLGLMYAKGRGVPQDYIQAYMWYNLAASNSRGDLRLLAVKGRNQAAKEMTPEDLSEAQRLASEWKPKSSGIQ